MIYLPDGQEMQSCDKKTIEYYQVPSMVLMERAALAFTDAIFDAGYEMSMVGIVCGTGNNGGDGLAVARLLHLQNIPVKVFLLGAVQRATEQTTHQLAILEKYEVPVYKIVDVEELKNQLSQCSLLIDGIFGVGLSREISGLYADVINCLNQCAAPTVAIDIPSGIHAGNGQVSGCAVKADMTVTFAFCKAGLVLYPGADYAGKVKVVEIGITKESLDEKETYLYTHSTDEILQMLPVRPARSNKGTFGKVVLVVGSNGMAGAAYLAAMAAYRTGCGLVRIVTPKENREILQSLVPEAVMTLYDSQCPQNCQDELLEALQWADVVGIGCGLGVSKSSEYLLELVLKNTKVPVVIDGDGLNIVAKNQELLKRYTDRMRNITQSEPRCNMGLVLTPHLGEMSRLTQISIKEIQQNIVKTASEYAKKYQICCVLKDARTVVTSGQEHAYLNLTGNNGMAKGGSGDILAGMICSLIAQGMEPQKASVAGVHLHGCAGDAAASKYGERGMIARDILECIPVVIK